MGAVAAGVWEQAAGQAGMPEDRLQPFSSRLFLTQLCEGKTLLKGTPQELRHLVAPQSSCAAAVRDVPPSFGFYPVITERMPFTPHSLSPVLCFQAVP